MIDQALHATSEMTLVVTFCMRQYRIKKTADYYTWFPNVVVDVFGKGLSERDASI